MRKDEIILITGQNDDWFRSIVDIAAKYALISVPFTYNRMEKKDLVSRIGNITKGKIAELLFYNYCKENSMSIDPEACTTPFWMPDKRDFLWLGGEWDIKNNYFYCSDADFVDFDCTMLPALIPNKTQYDQWSKRNVQYIDHSLFNAYVFTFLRLKTKDKNFLSFQLSDDQYSFLLSMVNKYNNMAHSQLPFLESWFYEKLNFLGSASYITPIYQPDMIITACANPKYWNLFQNIPSDQPPDLKLNDIAPLKWYKKQHNYVSFLNDALVTRIKNMACPVCLLPSFKSVLNQNA